MVHYLRKPFAIGIWFLFLGSLTVALAMAQESGTTASSEMRRILPHTEPLSAQEVASGIVLLQMAQNDIAAATADTVAALASEIGDVRPISDAANLYAVSVPPGEETRLAAKLTAHPLVRQAEPDYVYHTMGTPNDPLYARYQWNLRHIGADAAWEHTTGNAEIVIAVLDTGVDLSHPDLVHHLVAGYDFANDDADPNDDHGHGTHVASIAAATGNNGVGITGVAWQGKIMPVKVLDELGRGASSEIAQGIIWATDHGADVINLSLGATQYSETINEAVQYAHTRGVLIIAAAGNYYEGGNPIVYPAALNNVLAVAAVNDGDGHASYSSSGTYVDVAAPGGDPINDADGEIRHWIPGAFLRSTGVPYAWLVGTSQAAPHVAGLAALLLALDPSLTTDQMQSLITSSAVDVVSPGWDEFSGHGRVDAAAAIAALRVNVPTPTPSPTATMPPTPTPTSTPNPVQHPTDERRINSTITNSQSNAAIAVDRSGNLSVVWLDGRSGAEQIYSAHLARNSNNWGPNFSVTGSTNAAGSQSLSAPALSIDGQGNLHAAWLGKDDLGAGTLYHSIQTAGTTTWQNVAAIDAGFEPNIDAAPALVIGPDDTPTAAWTVTRQNSTGAPTQLIVWSRRPVNSAHWLPPSPLHIDDNGHQHEVVLAAAGGNLYAAWVAEINGTASLRISTLAQGMDAWSSPSVVMPLNPSLANHHPTLIVTDTGTQVLAWTDIREQQRGEDIFVTSRASGTGFWSAPVRVNDDRGSTRQHRPHLSATESGLVLVWQDNRYDVGDIFIAWSDALLTQWTPNRRVNQDTAQTLQESADVVLDPYGNTTIVWSDFRTGDAGPEVYARFIANTNRIQIYLSQIEAR